MSTVSLLPRTKFLRLSVSYSESRACSRCGGKHAVKDCFHINTVCYVCKARGHLARVCKSRKKKNYYMEDPPSDNDDTNYLFNMPSSSVRPFKTTVEINGQKVIDTGAAITVMSESRLLDIWKNVYTRPVLDKTRKIVRTYTKEEINLMGVVNVEVEYDTRVKLLPMYILPGDGPILMGRDWFLALQVSLVPTDLNYIDKKGVEQPIVQKLFDEFKCV